MNSGPGSSHRGLSVAAIVIACSCIVGAAGCTRGVAETEAKPQPRAVQFLGSWGVKGAEPGQLNAPTGIATDAFGNVYVADAGTQFIQKFDARGKPLLSFQEDALRQPQFIAVDSGGGIYVTDPVRGSVFVFFPGGDRYRELRLRTKMSAENELSVAIGDDGRVHVLDAESGKVFNYTPPPFRAAPSWLVPASALNSKARRGPIVAGPDGFIYVADPAGNRILRFTDVGHLVSEVDLPPGGDGDRMSGPFAVYGGYIFVVSEDGHTLHVVAIDGPQRIDVDLAPDLGHVAGAVSAIAVSPRKELFVLDGPQAKILDFRINF